MQCSFFLTVNESIESAHDLPVFEMIRTANRNRETTMAKAAVKKTAVKSAAKKAPARKAAVKAKTSARKPVARRATKKAR